MLCGDLFTQPGIVWHLERRGVANSKMKVWSFWMGSLLMDEHPKSRTNRVQMRKMDTGI